MKKNTVNCFIFEENTRQPHKDNFCLFRSFALHLHGNQKLEEETSEISNLLKSKMAGLSPTQVQGVHMNDIPIAEDLLLLNILLYDIDDVEGNIIG